jgi:hypothetical protein
MALGTSHPANFTLSSLNFFVECWVYFNTMPVANTQDYYIVQRGTGVYAAEDMGLRLRPLTGTNCVGFYVFGTNGSITEIYSGNLTTGTWYHIAASVTTTGAYYLFVNGSLQSSTNLNIAPRTSAGCNFFIGTPVVQSDWIATNAYVRDVRVLQGGAVPTSTFSVPANVPFGLGTPTYVAGMGTAVLSLYTQYFYPSWVSLSGNQGTYMNLGIPSGPYFSSTFNTFIQGWVYINSTAANAGYVIMSTATVEVNATEDWGLRVLSGGTLQFYLYNSSVVSTGVTSSSALSAGRWYHMAVSYIYNVGTYGTMYLFVNGVFQNSSAMSGGFPRFTSTNIITVGSRLTTLGWSPLNSYIQDLQFVRGGSVPTTTFTPNSAPFSLLAPSYVPGGTCVLSLATQYFLNTLATVTPSGTAGGYGPNGTGGDLTQFIAGNKVHFFTTVGTQTLTVTGSGYVTVLVVAGGGGGGYDRAAGGGAGGIIYTSFVLQPGTYTVTIGDGGAGSINNVTNGTNGQNSSFGSLIAVGGGGGGTYAAGFAGGSGGGGHGQASYAGGAAGPNNQGNIGGAGLTGTNSNSGGGGGANGAGIAGGNGLNAVGGDGGPGRLVSISGIPTYYAGGGGGSIAFDNFSGTSGKGLGGVGGGGNSGQTRGANGSPGTPNTGGGGGGGANIPQGNGGKGGSGIVIVSYPTAIPSYIGGYVPLVPVFSQISAGAKTSSVAAYSLRALALTSARVVNVRRSSDSATLDFYSTTSGTNLYSSTNILLKNWLAGSIGYVTTLYDQSGNAKDMIQGTVANQPVIDLTTSPYSIVFNGNNTYLYNSAVTFNLGAGVFTVRYLVDNVAGGCVVHKSDNLLTSWTGHSKKFWLGDGTTTEGLRGRYPSQVGNAENFVVSAGIGTGKFSVVHKATATTAVPIYINGTNQTLSTNNLVMANDPGNYLILGAGSASAYYAGTLYEMELFSTALSDADRLLLEN